MRMVEARAAPGTGEGRRADLSLQFLLGEGRPQQAGRFTVLPIFHPAAAIYDRTKRDALFADFEALRIEVRNLRTAAESRGETAPEVFLANLGPCAAYLPRIEFTRSFFALAGFRVDGDAQFDDPDLAAEAAARCGARIACIVSTDDRYPEAVPLLAAALKRARPGMRVLLAGLPAEPERVEAWRRSGVDEFIHLRADAHAILTALARSIGGEET